MIGLILGTKAGHKTAKKLAEILGWDYADKDVNVDKTYGTVFRYGNSYAQMPTNHGNVINWAFHLGNTIDKLQVRSRLLSYEVVAPKIYGENCIANRTIKYPAIARPRTHMKGRDFYFVNNDKEARNFIRNGFWLQQYIDKDREYRIFVLWGDVFDTSEKVSRPTLKFNSKVRNFDNGWTFKTVRPADLNRQMLKDCLVASQVLHLDFCAIDCCIDTTKQHYIFEVNTAPSLNERKLIKLAEKIGG